MSASEPSDRRHKVFDLIGFCRCVSCDTHRRELTQTPIGLPLNEISPRSASRLGLDRLRTTPARCLACSRAVRLPAGSWSSRPLPAVASPEPSRPWTVFSAPKSSITVCRLSEPFDRFPRTRPVSYKANASVLRYRALSGSFSTNRRDISNARIGSLRLSSGQVTRNHAIVFLTRFSMIARLR